MIPQDDAYFEFDRPELRALVPERARRVLDVGCGAGALGAALREERGTCVMGLELSPDAAARARERLDSVVEADLDALDDLPFERASFDAMVFGDVLEHLRDPIASSAPFARGSPTTASSSARSPTSATGRSSSPSSPRTAGPTPTPASSTAPTSTSSPSPRPS